MVCPLHYYILYILYIDINECETETDNCTQRCENTLGSFKCGCIIGCKLGEDKSSCDGITLVTLS